MRIFQTLWICRWWNSLHRLVSGVRIHPTACLLGNIQRIRLEPAVKIGAHCILDVGSVGAVFLDRRVWISKDVEIETTTKVNIGEGTTIQRRCTINGTTRLGANCILAPNVFVSSGTHPFRFIPHLSIREQERQIVHSAADFANLDRPVWIQDDCWLGANVVVCPGVTIGKGSVIGANSVVTRDVSPYTVVAGVPAKPIGQRMPWLPKQSIDADNVADHPFVLSGSLIKLASDNSSLIEISRHTPLLVALSENKMGRDLVLHWISTTPVQFVVAGHLFELPEGGGQFNLSSDLLTIKESVAYCMITLSDSVEQSTLRFKRIAFETE